MSRSRREALVLPARTTMRAPFTVRTIRELRGQRDDDGNTVDVLRVEGHASVFGYEYNVWGGPPYGWIETIHADAFDETLADDPDVVFLLNHEGMTMARTKSGTLTLEVDDLGLFTRADLDSANPQAVALVSAIDRGDIDEMSFAFRTTDQRWYEHEDWEGDEMSGREILGVNINRGDVSAVNFGASDGTDIDLARSAEAARADAVAEPPARLAVPDADVIRLLGIPDNPALADVS